ncbi:hypothetical protein HIM_07570 [Hirsutella minnesotensis 3608]|uniref:Aromatic prenyltransferase n=1 Tax=Hirsutella minnesotensis 3608 TaxID=1043627 RepID=A0A0F7ZTF0_9HYPO|nr:hypothetical protein HIM_07570 [Hirsutella minnesotensis 3608]
MTVGAQTVPEMSDPADLEYWRRHCAPILKSLLKSTGSYSDEEQEAQLQLLSDHVLPNLGPRPSKAHTTSFITQSQSPFQPQVNFNLEGPRVRYCWEPLGPQGGSESDPFCVEAAKVIVPALIKALGLYSQWNDVVMEAFVPTLEEARKVRDMLPSWFAAQLPPGVEPPPVTRFPFNFVAFELKGSQAGIKTYWNPKTKELASGVSATDLTWDFLDKLKPALNPKSIAMVREFLAAREIPSAVELVGVDCCNEADLADARIKLYVHTRSNSFDTLRDYMTLGGRLQDERTLKGLELLHKIWHLLLQQPQAFDNDQFEAPFSDGNAFYQKLYFCFELRPSKELPEVKSYVPTWHYVRSDDETVQNYEEIFRACGQKWGNDGLYRRIFEDAFGPAKHDRKVPIHCDASFLYTEKRGLYQSLYYSPVLEEEN